MMCQTRCSYQDYNGDCIYARGIRPCDIDEGFDYAKALRNIGEREQAKEIVRCLKEDKKKLKLREVL